MNLSGELVVVAIGLFAVLVPLSNCATKVDSIDRKCVSVGGDSKVIISGQDFDNKLEWDGDPETEGSHAYFASATHQYKCVTESRELTPEKLICRTTPMRAGNYKLFLKTGGNNVNYGQDKYLEVCPAYTPVVKKVSPIEFDVSDPPITTVYAILFTDKITSAETSSIGMTVQVSKIWVTDGMCDMVDENDNRYGVEISGSDGYGWVKCMIKSGYAGCHNASFILSGEHETMHGGRSIRANTALSVFGDYKLCSMQAYTTYECTVLSGSKNGGTELIVKGKLMDTSSTKVLVGGKECKITTKSDNEIKCLTPPEPTPPSGGFYCGDRGLVFDVYDGKTLDTLGVSSTADVTISFANGEIKVERDGQFAIHSRTFFVAPTDGTYEFGATLSDVVISISTNRDSANMVEYTSAVEMTKGTKYYMEVKAAGVNSIEFVLFTKIMNSGYTEKQTSMAITEVQQIKITSTVHLEIQTIKLDISEEKENTTNQENSDLQQTFKICSTNCEDVESGCNDVFRVRYFSKDLKIPLNEGLPDVESYINMMPELTGDKIQLKVDPSSAKCLLATITSFRGDIPIKLNIDDDSSTVEETASQIPASTSRFTPSMNGQPGLYVNILAVAPSIEEQMKNSLSSLCGVFCPNAIEGGIGVSSSFMDFEDDKVLSGEIYYEESYCGANSNKNPSYLYKKPAPSDDTGLPTYGIDIKWLCLAYKGPILKTVALNFVYFELDSSTGKKGKVETFDELVPSEEWVHKCINLESSIMKDTYVKLKLEDIKIHRDTTSDQDLLIDNLFLGEPNMHNMASLERNSNLRRVPATNDVRMKDIKVEKVEGDVSDKLYQVTLTPDNCGDNIPIIKAMTFNANNFEDDDRVTTTRTQLASPAVTGEFDLCYSIDGENVEVGTFPVDVKAYVLKQTLESQKHIEYVTVVRSGNCAGYTWDFTFNLPGGDFPSFCLKNTDNVKGEDAAITASTIHHGGLKIGPLSGDIFRTVHSTPQVVVEIEGIPQKSNGDCKFEYSTTKTPSINSVTPLNVNGGDQITIIGELFSTVLDENVVKVGGVACEVTAASSTEIMCTVGGSAAGASSVNVSVAELGLSNTQPINVGCAVSKIDQTTVTQNGGNILTIHGNGFGLMDSETVVTIGTHGSCNIKSVTSTWILCHLPYIETTAASVDVTVSVNSVACGEASIDLTASSASVSSVNASEVYLNDDKYFEINGNGFGTEQSGSSVYFGSHIVADVKTWSNVKIVVKRPKLSPAVYNVHVNVTGNGYASSSATITYVFEVASATPLTCGNPGGCTITVDGKGLHDDMEILVGGKKCIPTGAYSSTEAKCTLPSSFSTFTVKTGNSLDHGIGFAWSPSYLEVQVGDTVRWEWQVQEYLTNSLKYSIAMYDSVTDENPNEMIDVSDFKTGSGTFDYSFTKIGTYYYRSVCVDKGTCDINMNGTIKVTEMAPASTAALTVKSYGHFAIQSNSRKRRETSGETFSANCNFQSAVISLSGITPLDGTHETLFNIAGHGFVQDQTIVSVGTANCVIDRIEETQINCKIDPKGELLAGYLHEVTVVDTQTGKALVTIENKKDQYIGLLPNVQSIGSTSGSILGGTKLLIQGAGFNNEVTVLVGGQPCEILDAASNYQTIACYTSAHSAGEVTVDVIAGNANAVCNIDGGCKFTYVEQMVAKITDIQETIDGTIHTFAISGDGNFGTEKDKVNVVFGDIECTVSEVVVDVITCTIDKLPAGKHDVKTRLDDFGIISTRSYDFIATLSPPNPPITGSTEGIMLTFAGWGFQSDSLSGSCHENEISWNEIKCTVPPGDDSSTASYTILGTTHEFTYDSTVTPEVTSITDKVKKDDEITIGGLMFSENAIDVSVELGKVPCSVSGSSATEITCDAGAGIGGSNDIQVHIDGVGFARIAENVPFEYEFEISSISQPTTGSFGGGKEITINGLGFYDESSVNVCEKSCEVVGSPTFTEIKCKTPPQKSTEAEMTCDIVVTNENKHQQLSAAFIYKQNLTPEVATISPLRGGTAGGTQLTITGTRFGNAQSVSIDGSACAITSSSENEIICTTGEHKGSIKADVVVTTENGNSVFLSSASQYFYVDLWSSKFTWGEDLKVPDEGSLVVIEKGQTVLMDTTTVDSKVMKVILVMGELIFDDEKENEELLLQSEYILVMEGGLLQIGTKDNPFENKATIRMHGHLRSKELPIYGAKVLAVLGGGILDIHGKPVITWTVLEETANKGDNKIVLKTNPGWKVNDMISISSTGGRTSQNENEQAMIESISEDGTELTLNKTLDFAHLGTTKTFGSGDDQRSVEFRAEVIMQSRNIKFTGNTADFSWNVDIPKCPFGFDPGEFATQTCFQGRFGKEIGSDQFGAQIIIHGEKVKATARLEYFEMSNVGQAFRMGRYPVHFHLNGDMTGSYIRGVSVDHSFNRAFVIHGTHNVLVEWNTAYRTMGGTLFIEGGNEYGNIIQYNCIIMTIGSSSLQNDDVTPASYWVTSPNNIIQHNHASGGTHFGAWYRHHAHPDGPLSTNTICPDTTPLGTYHNNTAHSMGWFGIWIFTNYFPSEGGYDCQPYRPTTAVFKGLTSWHNEKGAEWVNAGAVAFDSFVLVDNDVTGVDLKFLSRTSWEDSQNAYISNTIISGTQSSAGMIVPLGPRLTIKDTRFYGVGHAFSLASATGSCTEECGGFEYRTRNVSFFDVDAVMLFKNDHDFWTRDYDGTLAKVAGSSIAPFTDIMDPAHCVKQDTSLIKKGGDYFGAICDKTVKLLRFTANNFQPSVLAGENLHFSNIHGNLSLRFRTKDLTHPKGYTGLLVSKKEYTISYENEYYSANFSYTARIDGLSSEEYVIIKQKLPIKPDGVIMNGNDIRLLNTTFEKLSSTDSDNLDWFYDVNTMIFSYIVKGSRTPGAGDFNNHADSVFITLSVYRCEYKDCIRPELPQDIPPFDYLGDFVPWTTRVPDPPHPCISWDDEKNVVTVKKTDNEDGECWVEMRNMPAASTESRSGAAQNNILQADQIIIEGNLAILNEDVDMTISVSQLVVIGRLMVGRGQQETFAGKLSINLDGEKDLKPVGPYNLEKKRIGVYGGMDLHGKKITGPTMAALAQPSSGNELILDEDVFWKADDEVVITTTSFDSSHTEVRTIDSVSGNKVVLKTPLEFTHTSVQYSFGEDHQLAMKSTVALLTRNIKITGITTSPVGTEEALYGGSIIAQNTGWMRISNTEFKNCGRFGFSDVDNPHYALAWLNTDISTRASPSSVSFSTFQDCGNTAIGVHGGHSIEITDNVVHRPVGSGIIIDGTDMRLERNLVAQMSVKWGVGIPNQFDSSLMSHWPASFDIEKAKLLTLKDNIAAGSQSFCFATVGQKDSTEDDKKWSGNVAHGCLHGVHVLPNGWGSGIISGFTVWKAYDFGIYQQTSDSMTYVNIKVADSRIGLVPITYGPNPTSFQFEDKYVKITDSLFVGRSTGYDCSDHLDESQDFLLIRNAFGGGASLNSRGGFTGILTPLFQAGQNGAPKKSFLNNKSYSTIRGRLEIKGVAFTQFENSRCSGNDYIFWTHHKNEDFSHPTYIWNVQKFNVGSDNLAFFDRPSLGKINPSDCVDMECDAKKKVMIKDMDGSFLGYIGAIIPQAEYAWGGTKEALARGLGDYRIPKPMYSNLDGSRRDIATLFPNKGIMRTEACIYHSDMQAYKCALEDYNQLVIESLDPDTETRRLSPVAVSSDKYIDLNNGPQDHGWCAGYTCQKRISLFYPIVRNNKLVEVFFTSTSPKRLRLHYLNVGQDEAVTLSIWYSNPQVKEVVVANQVVAPNNQRLVGNNAFYDQGSQYIPKSTDASGKNYLDETTGLLYVTVKGPQAVTINTLDAISLSLKFPAVTITEFYEGQIVDYIATFLNIPKENIYLSNPVSETSDRRRRSADDGKVTLIIKTGSEAGSTSTEEKLTELPGKTIEGNTISEVKVKPALNSADEIAKNDEALKSGSSTEVSIKTLDAITVSNLPRDDHEGIIFSDGIQIKALDDSGSVITGYGVLAPVTATATLAKITNSDTNAILEGTSTVNFDKGYAHFKDLKITHSGEYQITFVESGSTTGLTVTSEVFTIKKREVSATFAGMLNDDGLLTEGASFDVKVQLTDENKDKLENIDFKGYSWKVLASLDEKSLLYPSASLAAPTEQTFDISTSEATVSGLVLTGTDNYNSYNVKFNIWSEPDRVYEFHIYQTVQIYPSNEEDYKHNKLGAYRGLGLQYSEAYENLDDDKETLKTFMHNWMNNLFPNIYFSSVHARNKKGKLYVEYDIQGESGSVLDAGIKQIYDNMTMISSIEYKSRTLTLSSSCPIKVDGHCYKEDDKTSAETNWKILAPAIVLSVLVAIGIIALAHYMKIKYRSGKINDSKSSLRRLESPIEKFETISELQKSDNLRDQAY